MKLKRILVAFDGSPKSYDAFDFALELSKLCSEMSPEITVLSVVQPPEPVDIVEVDAYIDNVSEHYEKLFRELREIAKTKNVEIRTDIAVGHPADQIVRYCSEIKSDMVIVGQKGKSKIESWLVGSVSKRVSTYAPCTVTIVK